MSMQYNRDELGFLKSKFNQRDHVQEKWNVLWVTNTTRGNAKEIEINFGFKESNADFSVDKIEKFCVSKSTLSSLLNDPDLTVPEPKPCGNWSNFMESADMSYFWQREDNTLKETNVKVPATVRIQNVQNVPKSVLKPYYPKSTSSSSSSSLPTQKKGTIVPRNSGGKKSDKTPKIQALQKIGDSRSSSQISSQKRSEELKKNEENSSAIYTQADYERLYDEEKADEAGNEDMDDGDNTGPSDTGKDSMSEENDETIEVPGPSNHSTTISDRQPVVAVEGHNINRTNSVDAALTTTTLFFVEGVEVDKELYNRYTKKKNKSTRVVLNVVEDNDFLRCCCLRNDCTGDASGSQILCHFTLKRAHALCIGGTNECYGCIKRNSLRNQFEIHGLQAVMPSIRDTLDFNCVGRPKGVPGLRFGILTFDGDVFPHNAAMRQVRNVELSEERLVEVKALPIRIDKQQPLNESWYDYLFNKNSKYLWHFNHCNGSLTKTHITHRLRGGFLTRQGAKDSNIAISNMREFNNNGTSLEYRDLPRDYICGLQGFCAVIAAYYICQEMTLTHVESLKNQHHTEMQIDSTSTIFVTNGTYTVVDNINALQTMSTLKCIFPTKENYSLTGSQNYLFRNSSSCGKFLVELKDKACGVDNDVSHFVSLDTHKMEIYDPMCVSGAIVAYRSMNDTCLFLESLQLQDVVNVHHIWELVDFVFEVSKKRLVNEVVQVEEIEKKKKQKKRTGKKKIKEFNNH